MPEVLTLCNAEPDLSTFENKTGLAEDMKFLASMPELCDVTFLVGDTRDPVCAVKVYLFLNIYKISLMLFSDGQFFIVGCVSSTITCISKNVVPSTITTTQERAPTTRE